MVNKINRLIQDIASTILGSQEWKGAAPNLIIILIIIKICLK